MLTPDTDSGQAKEVIHPVCFGQTIEGVALTYGVSVARIRQRNQLDSDEIFTRKTLTIPDPKISNPSSMSPEELQRVRRELMLTLFLDQLKPEDKSRATALFYLKEADWVFEQAQRLYDKDLAWEDQVRREDDIKSQELQQELRGVQSAGCLSAITKMFSGSQPEERKDYREMVPINRMRKDD